MYTRQAATDDETAKIATRRVRSADGLYSSPAAVIVGPEIFRIIRFRVISFDARRSNEIRETRRDLFLFFD